MLAVNLKDILGLNHNLTFLQWLRDNDYIYINYDRDNGLG